MILGGSATGLSFARSLGRRGAPILLLESQPLLGTYSRYTQFIRLPPADEQPQTWLDLLELAGSRLDGPAVLLPTSDVYCLLAAQHADQLRRHFRFINPDSETVERLVNKRAQYEAVRAAGVPAPDTYFPASAEEARLLAGKVKYPCLLKPYVAHTGRRRLGGRKVLLAKSPAELVAGFERLAAPEAPFLVQEYIPGEDDAVYGYLAFWDESGRELAWLTMRKLRQNPPYFGDASLMVTTPAAEAAELSRHVLRALDYRGFAGIEFKYDKRDGACRLIEINPRSEAFVELAIGAGVDFPWIGYQYLTGGPPQTPPGFRMGVKYVNEELEIQAYLAYRQLGRLGFGRWLRSLRNARTIIWAWDDPRPMLVGLGRFAALARRRTPRPWAATEDNGAAFAN